MLTREQFWAEPFADHGFDVLGWNEHHAPPPDPGARRQQLAQLMKGSS